MFSENMAIDEQFFSIKCKGRNKKCDEVLKEAIDVKVIFVKENETDIYSKVECKYHIKPDGCKAAHPKAADTDIICPYACELPDTMEFFF